jgi:hypothetical protein
MEQTKPVKFLLTEEEKTNRLKERLTVEKKVEAHQINIKQAKDEFKEDCADAIKYMKETIKGEKDRIAELTARMTTLADEYTTGYGEIMCRIEYHTPFEGQKTVTRLDNNKADVYPMTNEEKKANENLDIFQKGEKKKDESDLPPETNYENKSFSKVEVANA